MEATLIQVAYAGSSGLPEDVYVNTFHVGKAAGELSVPEVEDIVDALHAALLDTDEDDRNLLSWLSEEINTTVSYRAYRLSDPEPRAPIFELEESIAGGTTGNGRLPAEVALCLSYQAVPVSGLPQARRRGRVFIGPLRPTACATTTGRPDTNFVATMQHYGNQVLLGIPAAVVDAFWTVWSPTNDNGVEVEDGWVDNAFDTQRRRGLRPTSRVTFPS